MTFQSGISAFEPARNGAAGVDSDGISIGQILGTLWRRRLVVILTTLGIAAAGFVAIKVFLTPSFTSTAVLVLSAPHDPVVDTQSTIMHTPSSDAVVRSEADALQSRSLVDRVIDRENLMDDPEFNVYAQPFKPNLLTRLGIASHLPTSFLRGLFLSKPLDPNYLTPAQLKYNVETQVLKAYDVSLDAKTYTVKVSFTSIDAETASRVANAFVQEYMRSQVDERLDANENALEVIKPRLDTLRQKVEEADEAVEDFKTKNNIIDLPGPQDQNTTALQAIQNLTTDLSNARAQRARLEAAEQEVQGLASNPGGALSAPVVALSPAVENARSQEAAASAHLAELRGIYGANHPQVLAAESEVKQLGERLNVEVRHALAQLRIETRQAENNEAQLQARMRELTTARTDQTGVLPRLRLLEAEQASAHSIYNAYTQGFYRATETDGVPTAKGRIIQVAHTVDWPTFPNIPIFMAVIFIAGFMIAFGVVYILEAKDKAFHTAREIEAAIGVRVLGMTMLVPKALRKQRRKLLPNDSAAASISRQLVANPTSAMSEMVRLVRTAIAFSRVDRNAKVVMVTSAVPGEGKTTFALMLGRLSALSGKRVLVIEAEMRNPTFNQELSRLPPKGLTEYLQGRATFEEVVDVDPESGAHFIAVSERSKFAGELLMSSAMASLVERARATYDLVVIDTPPVTITADALGIGELIDTTVLMVKWGSTPAHLVRDAAEKLRAANVPLAGAVMTQVDVRRYTAYGEGALPSQYARAYYSMVA